LLLPDWGLMQQLDTLEVTHSQLTHEHLYQIAAVRAYNLRRNGEKRGGRALQSSGSSSSSSSGICDGKAEAAADAAAVESADAVGMAGEGSSELDEHMSCLADLRVFAYEDVSSSSSSGEERVEFKSASKGDMCSKPGDPGSSLGINASRRDTSKASSSGGRAASNCSILDLQLLRRLTLSSSKRVSERRLTSWLVFAMQFKHKLLLQLGQMFGVQEGFMGLSHLQGASPYCNFDMLVEMFSGEEDLTWY